MATVSITGFGGHLANGGVAGTSYTNVAQMKKIDFDGLTAKFEDVTNMDSPAPGGAVFTEWIKVEVDGGSVSFDGVLNPADPTIQAMLTNLQTAGNNALNFWKITLSSGSTLIFQAFVEKFKLGIEYNKMVPFSGALKIVGPISQAW